MNDDDLLCRRRRRRRRRRLRLYYNFVAAGDCDGGRRFVLIELQQLSIS
jgi:hypothetical protein